MLHYHDLISILNRSVSPNQRVYGLAVAILNALYNKQQQTTDITLIVSNVANIYASIALLTYDGIVLLRDFINVIFKIYPMYFYPTYISIVQHLLEDGIAARAPVLVASEPFTELFDDKMLSDNILHISDLFTLDDTYLL